MAHAMGKAGLRQTALMLAAAICGVGTSAAYFGVAGSHAKASASLSEFIRITLPTAVGLPAQPAPATAEIASSLLVQEPAKSGPQFAAAGIPLAALTREMSAQGTAPAGAAAISESLREVRPLTSLPVIRYNLAGGAMSTNAIQTEKKIAVEGASAARIKVRIDENSTIYLDAEALSGLLPSAKIPQSTTGYVSFEQLRSEGVAVRYDAALDTIQLQPEGT